MDLLAFLTWQFVFFSLGIMAVILFFRRIIEFFIPSAKQSKFWNELFLPTIPIPLGGLLAFGLKNYPYANGLTTTRDHIYYGIIAGLLSGLIYKVVKGLLGNQIQNLIGGVVNNITNINNTSSPPLPPNLPQPPSQSDNSTK